MKQDQDEIHVKLGDKDLTLHEIFSMEVGAEYNIEKWEKFIKPTVIFAVLCGILEGMTTGIFAVSGGLMAALSS